MNDELYNNKNIRRHVAVLTMLMYLKASLLQFAHPDHIHTLMKTVAGNNSESMVSSSLMIQQKLKFQSSGVKTGLFFFFFFFCMKVAELSLHGNDGCSRT